MYNYSCLACGSNEKVSWILVSTKGMFENMVVIVMQSSV